MSINEPHSGHRSVSGGLARATVFGASDGLVSNVSLLLGFAGSGVDGSIVQLAGIAGAVAGAISMAAGEWVSVSSQNDLIDREIQIERREHRHNRDHETRELAALYESQGIAPERAAAAAADVMRRPDTAVAVHTRQELGIDPDDLPSAWRAAALSFVSFVIGAVLPLLPWLVTGGIEAIIGSMVIGVTAAAVIGGLVAQFAERRLWLGITRQVGIVIVACTVTYAIGELVGINLA